MPFPYPLRESYDKGFIRVSDLHNLYYEQSGKPDGKPVIFIHGGPGGGFMQNDVVFFDPNVYRVILFDQRGCGKSEPTGEIKENTTWDLVADIETIRKKFEIEKWMVFGGSWGSTLSLAYAETHPDRVASLIIRGIYLADDAETRWFYQTSTKAYYPEEWEEFASMIVPEKRHDLIYAYNELLLGPDKALAEKAAQQWTRYEFSCYKLLQDADYAKKAGEGSTAWAKTVVECHYFLNNCFMEDGHLISEPQISKIRHIPCQIVNGRYDVVCPPHIALKLRKAYGEKCALTWIPDAGHTAMEEGSMAALSKAADEFAKYQ